MPYIGSSPPVAPVTSVDITDGSIANTDMAIGSITPHALASGAVTSGKIATGGVSANTQLATGIVTAHATAADIAKTDVGQEFTLAQRGKIATIGVKTSGSAGSAANTVTLSMSNSNHWSVTTNANITFANPTNISTGQGGSIVLTSNGSYTVSWGSYWRFATGTAPTMSTTAGKQDRVDYYVASSNTIHTVATIDLLGTA